MSDLTPLEQHQRAVERLCRDVDVVESVAALLVESERRMIEARFLLLTSRAMPHSTSGAMPLSNVAEAVAVLEAGIADVRAALGTSEDTDE